MTPLNQPDQLKKHSETIDQAESRAGRYIACDCHQCFPCHYIRGGGPSPQWHPPPPLKVKLIYFLYSARSQQKSFKVTFPIEKVYTLFFY